MKKAAVVLCTTAVLGVALYFGLIILISEIDRLEYEDYYV